MTPLIVYRCRLQSQFRAGGRRDRVNECDGDVTPIINLASIPCDAVTPAESRVMLLYNGSRVHNAKYELVGLGLASASGLFVWFCSGFKNDPGASLDTWR